MAFWDIIDPFLLLTGWDLHWIGGRFKCKWQSNTSLYLGWFIKRCELKTTETCLLKNKKLTASISIQSIFFPDVILSFRAMGLCKFYSCFLESILLKSILTANNAWGWCALVSVSIKKAIVLFCNSMSQLVHLTIWKWLSSGLLCILSLPFIQAICCF